MRESLGHPSGEKTKNPEQADELIGLSGDDLVNEAWKRILKGKGPGIIWTDDKIAHARDSGMISEEDIESRKDSRRGLLFQHMNNFRHNFPGGTYIEEYVDRGIFKDLLSSDTNDLDEKQRELRRVVEARFKIINALPLVAEKYFPGYNLEEISKGTRSDDEEINYESRDKLIRVYLKMLELGYDGEGDDHFLMR